MAKSPQMHPVKTGLVAERKPSGKTAKKGGRVGEVDNKKTVADDKKTAVDDKKTVASGEKRLYCRVQPLLRPTKSIREGIDNVVPVNYDSEPIIIHNEHFTGYAIFRVNHFDGMMPLDETTNQPLPTVSTSDYFKGHRRTFSLQLSGRFRREWSADDVMFGTFFERPVSLPPGYKIALALARKIDASMDGDLSTNEPYMCSPLICAMNVARADPIILPRQSSSNGQTTVARGDCVFSHDAEESEGEDPLYLPPWQYGGGRHMEENFMATVASWPESKLHQQGVAEDDDSDPLKDEASVHPSKPTADKQNETKRSGSLGSFFFRTSHSNATTKTPAAVTPAQRRSWFLNPDHRHAYKFHPDTLYSFDFNNQYVDLNRMQLKLGLSFDVSHYLNGQPVRYQMRSRDGTVVFFTISLGLA